MKVEISPFEHLHAFLIAQQCEIRASSILPLGPTLLAIQHALQMPIASSRI
jgi:hypothetical protein